MVDDTFAFGVKNPAEAYFDITGVTVQDYPKIFPAADCIEDGVVEYDHTLVEFVASIHNDGEITVTKNVVLYDSEMSVLETKPLELAGGISDIVTFDNTAAGFVIADGTTVQFTVKVEELI